MAVAFVVLAEGRLWNARLLPFYYLGLYLLAALGVAEVGRTHRGARRPATPTARASIGPALAAGVVAARRLRRSSACRCGRCPGGQPHADGSYSWLVPRQRRRPAELRAVAGRSWNYTGYEGKARLPRVPRPRATRWREVGEEHGCGRAMWEYEKELNRYGTPMALMLLPYWTDGCIGSMEGLFFEASATTPFHFLNQAELSRGAERRPARPAVRHASTSTQGVQHLQLMGVRYYLATSAQATDRGAGPPRPHRAGDVGPVGRSSRSPTATSSSRSRTSPPCSTASSDDQHDWICRVAGTRTASATGRRSRWYIDPDAWDVFLAADRPGRVAARRRLDDPDPRCDPCRRPTVTDIDVGTDTHLLRRRRGRHAGAGEDVVLPELAGRRRRGPVPRRAEPDGRGAHVDARRAAPTAASRSSGSATRSRCSASALVILLAAPPVPGSARAGPARTTSRAAEPDDRRRAAGRAADAGDADGLACTSTAVTERLRRLALVALVPTAVDIGLLVVLRQRAGWILVARRPRRHRGRVASLSYVAAPRGHVPRRPVRPLGADARRVRRRGRGGGARRRRRAARAVRRPRVRHHAGAGRRQGRGARWPPPSCGSCSTARVLLQRRPPISSTSGSRGRRRRAPCGRPSSSRPSTRRPRIGATVAAVRAALAASPPTAASRSSSSTTARPTAPPTPRSAAGADQVVVLPENRGKGAAVRAGVAAARGRTIAFTDADLAYSPDQLLRVLGRGRGRVGRRGRQPPPPRHDHASAAPAGCATSAAGSSTCSPWRVLLGHSATPSAG